MYNILSIVVKLFTFLLYIIILQVSYSLNWLNIDCYCDVEGQLVAIDYHGTLLVHLHGFRLGGLVWYLHVHGKGHVDVHFLVFGLFWLGLLRHVVEAEIEGDSLLAASAGSLDPLLPFDLLVDLVEVVVVLGGGVELGVVGLDLLQEGLGLGSLHASLLGDLSDQELLLGIFGLLELCLLELVPLGLGALELLLLSLLHGSEILSFLLWRDVELDLGVLGRLNSVPDLLLSSGGSPLHSVLELELLGAEVASGLRRAGQKRGSGVVGDSERELLPPLFPDGGDLGVVGLGFLDPADEGGAGLLLGRLHSEVAGCGIHLCSGRVHSLFKSLSDFGRHLHLKDGLEWHPVDNLVGLLCLYVHCFVCGLVCVWGFKLL